MGTLFWCMAAGAAEANEKVQLKPEWWKGDDFAWIRGANYVPSYAGNDVEQWLDYKPDVVERELELATRLRLSTLRVWLQYFDYEVDRKKFLANLEDFLSRCEKHGIRLMLVLFDGCFGADPSLDAPGWVASPGPVRMQKEYWPKLEKYVDEVVGAYVGDPRILFWDVMNEPSSLGTPEILKDPEAAWKFARAFCDYVRKADRTHPATVGVGNHAHIPYVLDHVDVVTFHSYQSFEKTFRMDIAAARRLCGGKAMVITETTPSDMGQDPEMTFRVLKDEKIGWYFWHLVMGKLPLTVTTSPFDANGMTYCPDFIASALGFAVHPQAMGKRLDRFTIGKMLEDIESQPTSDDTYDFRHRASFELGRSMAWAGIALPVEITVRAGETQALLDSGKKAEAYALFDLNAKALAMVARESGVLDELNRERAQ